MATVFKNPKGVGFIGQASVIDKTGARRRVTVRALTEAAALNKLAVILDGPPVDPPKPKPPAVDRERPIVRRRRKRKLPGTQPVAAYMAEWIDNLQGSRAKLERYSRVVRRYVLPEIGSLQLSDVRPTDVEKMLIKIKGSKCRSYVYIVCGVAFSRAKKYGYIADNPCAAVPAPRTSRTRRLPLSLDQVLRLIESVKGTPHYALIITAVLTGLREGELFGLQRGDVDLAAGRIFVRHALKETIGRLYLEEPKSDAGMRCVDLPAIVVDALRDQFATLDARRYVHPKLAGYVFLSKNGKPIRCSNFTARTWPRILNAAKLPHFPFHSLRHTMASLLLSANVHQKVVQERMGHSSINVTMDTYSHLIPTMQREAADKLNGMFAH